MPALLNRRAIRLSALLPLAMALCLAAGCGDSGSGDFRSYGELDPAPQSSGQPPSSDSTAALPADARDQAPDTSASLPDSTVADAADSPAIANTEPPSAASAGESATRQPVAAPRPGLAGNPVAAAAGRLPVEAPRPGPDSFPAAQVVVREVKLLVPEQTFRTEGPQSAIRITYDDIDLLKVLNMEPVTANAPELMPEWMKALDGQRVRIRGFMYPPFQETGIEAFALARDNQICCFGKNPKIYDLFPVFLRKGHTTDYILNRPFDVVGVFHIDPIVDEDGKPEQLYLIDDAIVIDR